MDSSPTPSVARNELDIERQDNYAFLNHSASTLYHSLPPDVDDKPLARQKRKRTSPEDQAVLEAAYRRDPKPDKSARLEIVDQVALGEKEVQIWFQNRRQSSRRKSRPLMPHEIAKYSFVRAEPQERGFQSDHPFRPELDFSSSPNVEIPKSSSSLQRSVPPAQYLFGECRPGSSKMEWLSSSPSYPRASNAFASLTTPGRNVEISALSSNLNTDETNQMMTPNTSPALDVPGSDRDLSEDQAAYGTQPRLPIKKVPSFVRLSMGIDGNAGITTRDASSPSPPRPSQFSDTIPSLSITKGPSRAASGRSRDSRSWEFWCDKEARSELEHKAEKDASGSATSAIGLMRSTSGRSILGSLPSKRNAVFSRHRSSSAKRPKVGQENHSLHRSNTSLGRLERRHHRSHTMTSLDMNRFRPLNMVSIPGNESDKENWSPDHEAVSEDRKPKPSCGNGATNDNDGNRMPCTPPRHTTSSFRHRRGNPRTQSRSRADDGIDPEKDAELAAFMHAGQNSSSPSEEDDLDCVQGLLSLSQGNWR